MQFIVIQRKDKGLAGFPLSTSAIIYSLQPWCFLSTAFYSQTLDPGWRNSRPTPIIIIGGIVAINIQSILDQRSQAVKRRQVIIYVLLLRSSVALLSYVQVRYC